MKQYFLSLYHPDGPPPPKNELDEIMGRVNALRREMERTGALVFTAGLAPADTATVVRFQGEDALMTDGPFLEGKEHVGGFCIVNAADLDAALEWARKLARATTLPIEVRAVQHHEGG